MPSTIFEGMAKPMPTFPPLLLIMALVDADQAACGIDKRTSGVTRIDRGTSVRIKFSYSTMPTEERPVAET